MKRWLAMALALSLCLSLCACGKKKTEESMQSEEPVKQTAAEQEPGTAHIRREEGKVELTIPAELLSGTTTQEEYDSAAKSSGYDSITLQKDGSLLYVMSEEMYQSVLDTTENSIRSQLQDMIRQNIYEGFTSVSCNEDYSEYTVTIKGEEIAKNAAYVPNYFYALSSYYYMMLGEPMPQIRVKFIQEGTQKVLAEYGSTNPAE